ncbi:MAG: FtsX-like permease family protein [Pseudomonadota bacterium]
MLNYLTVLLRNFRRERLYTAINLVGLSLGVACCLVLGLFLKSELTYDAHFKGNEHIYRVVNEFTTGGANDKFAVTSQALGPLLAEQYPATVKAYVRFRDSAGRGGAAIRHGDTAFYWEHAYFVDQNVFEVFSHRILAGDPKTALVEPGSIAVSASFAKKYFGDDNPIGQILTTDDGAQQKVTLVFADLPPNTHLKYDLLMSYNAPWLKLDDNPGTRRRALMGIGIYTYLVMDRAFKPAEWAHISDDFADKNMNDMLKTVNAQWRSWLQPLREQHLQSEVTDPLPTGNRMYLYGCAAVALVILIIACINYMNLATARATRRARSIGIRKILGASRFGLAMQFLGEAILFALIALVLGVVIVEVVLKFTPINLLMDGQVGIDLLHQPQLALLLVGFALAIGLLSGAYPAIYLSSWAPLTALTGKQLAGKGNLRMRELLVLVQFTISAAAIACTLLMLAQMHYVANRPLGFEKHNRLIISLRGSSTLEKIEPIRNSLQGDSHIAGTAVADVVPGDVGTPVNLVQIEDESGAMVPMQFNNFPIGPDFEKVLGLQMAQGRDLSSRLLTDVGSNLLVNEAMVKKMGWTNPLGKRIAVGGGPGRVVGVVKDFNFKSLHTQIEPVIMYRRDIDESQIPVQNRPFRQRYLIVDISNERVPQTLAFIQKIVTDADARHPFEYRFLDDSLDAMYKSEARLTQLIGIFAAISVLIACMGLFGLAAFTTEQRTREIGTRKVLGATSWQIVTLLARPVLVLVVIASLLAAVGAWFAVDEWLSSFAYRAQVNPLIFLLATALATTVAFATVALQSWKTASADPVESLRHV